ncbi:MAG: PIN domain-containing protein [Pirellulales bacterium]
MIRPGRELLVLDTSIFVHVVRDDATGRRIVAEHGLTERVDRPLFTSVSEGEARAMAIYRRWGPAKLDRLGELFANLVRIDAGHPQIVAAYAELHAMSENRGLNIGQNDMWIAACAHFANATVLTCDKDFTRVPDEYVPVVFVETVK